MPRPIIVLGTSRSGTSAITNLVHEWGAYVAEDRLVRADGGNAAGYWEYEPLVRFDESLLHAVHASVTLPPSDDDEALLRNLSSTGSYRVRGLDLIASMDTTDRPWVWKDPRLSGLLPFWQPLWGDAIYVVAVRHPCEVARSLYNTGIKPLSACLLVWQRYVMQILKFTGTQPFRLFVSYNNLLANPQRECMRLCDFLDAATTCASDSEGKRKKTARMIAAIRSGLRHHHGGRDPLTSLMSRSQQQLQAGLDDRAADVGIETDLLADCEIFPGWREYLSTCALLTKCLRSLDADERRRAALVLPRLDPRLYGPREGGSLPRESSP